MFNCCLFLPSRPFCCFLAKRGLVVRFIIFSRVEQVGYTVNPVLRAYLFQALLRRGGGGGGLGLIDTEGLFQRGAYLI